MKTPMQELIEQMWEIAKYGDSYEVAPCIEAAEAMLEKEKEVMCQFQSDGQRTDFWVKYKDNDDCFDKTFKTKER